jgi:hypothetical protein
MDHAHTQLMEYSLKGYIKSGFYLCRRLVTQSTALIYKGILSLLFSFMIVYDLPRLASGAKTLARSRLKFPYEVLAPKVRELRDMSTHLPAASAAPLPYRPAMQAAIIMRSIFVSLSVHLRISWCL